MTARDIAKTARQELHKHSDVTKGAAKWGLIIPAGSIGCYLLAEVPRSMAIDLANAGDPTLFGSNFWMFIYLIAGLVTCVAIYLAYDKGKLIEVLVEKVIKLELDNKELTMMLIDAAASGGKAPEMSFDFGDMKGDYIVEERVEEEKDGSTTYSWDEKRLPSDPVRFLYLLKKKPPTSLAIVDKMLSASEGIGNKTNFPDMIWAKHRGILLNLQKKLEAEAMKRKKKKIDLSETVRQL